MQETRYSVIKRTYDKDSDSDNYCLVNYAENLSVARDAAENKKGKEGDIFIVCDSDDVTDLKNASSEAYVVDNSGEAKFVRHDYGKSWGSSQKVNWMKDWEGDRSCATDMVSRADLYDVDLNKIAMVLCACIRERISYLPVPNAAARKIIEIIEDRAASGTITRFMTDLDDIRFEICRDNAEFDRKFGGYNYIGKACERLSSMYNPGGIVSNVANASAESYKSDLGLASVVRRFIPLRDMLLAAVKMQAK